MTIAREAHDSAIFSRDLSRTVCGHLLTHADRKHGPNWTAGPALPITRNWPPAGAHHPCHGSRFVPWRSASSGCAIGERLWEPGPVIEFYPTKSEVGGGGGGIRTPGEFDPSTVFKTAAIDRSATPPGVACGRFLAAFAMPLNIGLCFNPRKTDPRRRGWLSTRRNATETGRGRSPTPAPSFRPLAMA